MSFIKKPCELCTTEFESYRGIGKYCSDECKKTAIKNQRPRYKEVEKKWRIDNKSHLKEKKRQWEEENKDKRKEYQENRKDKYHANKDEEKAKRDSRRSNNIEKYSKTQQKYRSQDKIRIARNIDERNRYKQNKELIKEKNNKRYTSVAVTAINKYQKWTKLEEEKLIYLHQKRTNHADIAKELNRTLDSIYNRARKLHKDGRLNLHFGSKHIFIAF